ncbi:MAG: hypothetical protein RR248_02445 [Clostridia bacterium]
MKSRLNFLSIFLKLAVIILGFVGICSPSISDQFMSTSKLFYFTIQSNIFIMAICLVFLIFEILRIFFHRAVAIPNWLRAIKFVCTVAITLTFLVFTCLLMPSLINAGMADYLIRPANLCCHNLVPILALVDFLVFDHVYISKKFSFLQGVILPLIYLPFILICSVSGIDFGNGAIVPYFFLDYVTNGWFKIGDGKLGVFYWIIILVIIVIGLAYLLMLLKNRIALKVSVASTKKD